MAIHVVGLLAVATSSLAEGVYGAELVAIPVQIVAALAAVAVVMWRRNPTIGVIVAGWLALGPIAMPFVKDNLNSGKPGLIASTVVYLVAIVIALGSGVLAMVDNRRRGARTGALTDPRR
jgi:hypothetical protein